jgi:hypothetical protein
MAPTKGQIIGELEALKEQVERLFRSHNNPKAIHAVQDRADRIEDMVKNLETSCGLTDAGKEHFGCNTGGS